MKHDEITQPEWYRWHPLTKSHGIECKHIAGEFNYFLGACIKYIWRAGRKGSDTALKDLKKAREYLDNEIRRLEPPTKGIIAVKITDEKIPVKVAFTLREDGSSCPRCLEGHGIDHRCCVDEGMGPCDGCGARTDTYGFR